MTLLRKHSGNVLFLILIAVALFAALSYAILQSSRTGGDGVAKDKAKLYAAQFVQYGNEVEQAISRIRVINRTPEYGLDVVSPVTWNATANATCATNACKIFHLEGGGVSPRFIDEAAFDLTLPVSGVAHFRTNHFRVVSIKDVGSDLDELVLQINSLRKDVCSEVNKLMGIDDGGNPPSDNSSVVSHRVV